MKTGIIPGNRSLQNVDIAMNQYPTLLFTDETIHQHPESIKAGLFSTLGFGHVGAIGLFLSGRLFDECLSDQQLNDYRARLAKRSLSIVRRLHEMRLGSGKPLFVRSLPGAVDPSKEAEFLLSQSFNANDGVQSDLKKEGRQ